MDEKDRKNLNKILEHAKYIVEETNGIKNAEDFKNSNEKSKAALFDLLQMGELANNLSKELTQEMTNIPWNNVFNLRNRIVHGYAGVDYEIIWETIKINIPYLIKELTKTLK